MWKYTVRKDYIAQLLKIRRAPYVLNKEYHYIQSLMPAGSNYMSHSAFSRWAVGFVFYSPKKLQQVPLNGILFPADMFDCEEVS
jgi:hypothetical protein